MSKAFIYGFIAGVILLIVGGVAGFQLHQKDPEQERNKQEFAKYQAEIVDATPVQPGLLTVRQRGHSRLYSHYKETRGDQKISDLAKQATGEYKMVSTVAFVGHGQALQPDTPENFFGSLAQASDAVIRGRATKKESQITEDDSFVFTDYDVVVLETIKANSASQLNAGTTITVTFPGGKVLLGDVIVNAVEKAYSPLPLNGHEVVLFLKYIPETGTYKTTRPTGSFELDGNNPKSLTGRALPPGVLKDNDSFLRVVRAVSNK